MSHSAALNVTRIAARVAITGLVGIWLSGCSADSTRLSEPFTSPFSNPFSTASSETAAAPQTLAANQAPAQLNGGVGHTAPVAVAALPPGVSSGQIKTAATQPVSGSSNGWRTAGGSPIIVAEGETLDTISSRYGVPSGALLNANGFTTASQVHGGTRLIIPVYDAGSKVASSSAKGEQKQADASDSAPHAKAKSAKAKKKADDLADAQDDAAPLKKHDKKKPEADVAQEPAKAPGKPLAQAGLKPPADPAKTAPGVVAKADADPKTAAGAKKKLLAPDTTTTGSVHAEAPAPTTPLTGVQADAAGVTPEFRWPARGRIIQGFKAGGNDGINIAVPEGTSVKAAESGVVAYAGSELKGYGNLVLIRHPNGFVSAYANNGELDVKRGETVKRGQIIAKSGQSGNVNSPQLHFELRKGSTPVDPTNLLAGL